MDVESLRKQYLPNKIKVLFVAEAKPDADYDAMSNWQKAINDEYPNFNTVGETWGSEPAYTAWWQKDSKLSAPRNSNLKTVMDFSFMVNINKTILFLIAI